MGPLALSLPRLRGPGARPGSGDLAQQPPACPLAQSIVILFLPLNKAESRVLKSMGRGIKALVLVRRGCERVSSRGGRVLGWQVSPLLPAGVGGSILAIIELPPLLLMHCFLFLGSFKFLLYSQQPWKSDPFY